MSRDDARPLGPEMLAERWVVIGGDHIIWMHGPSRRVVVLDGPVPRRSRSYDCMAIPALPAEPTDPLTEGYIVWCYVWDDLEEQPGAGEAFWVESYGVALRAARRIRQTILDEQKPWRPTAEQIGMFGEEAEPRSKP